MEAKENMEQRLDNDKLEEVTGGARIMINAKEKNEAIQTMSSVAVTEDPEPLKGPNYNH